VFLVDDLPQHRGVQVVEQRLQRSARPSVLGDLASS
jgi:hypothetical protein